MKIQAIRPEQLTADHLTAWSDLHRADTEVDNPCFHPEFALATATVRDDLEVAVIQEQGRYVGFLPFHRGRRNTATPLADLVTDMHGIVARRGLSIDAMRLLRDCRLTCWQFDHLIASQESFQPHHLAVEDSPYIDLSDGYEAYELGQRKSGTSMFSRARQKTRKLDRELGPLRFEMHTDCDDAFATLLKWKRSQLQQSGGNDTFRHRWVVELMDRLRHTQTEDFAGLLSALYAGERLIAVKMSLRCRDVISSWIPTYDAELGKYSPGLILHLEHARQAAEMGVRRIDLGRGYNQLKASLMNGSIPLALGTVESRAVSRLLTATWYRARRLAHSSSWGRIPLTMYRKLRVRLTP